MSGSLEALRDLISDKYGIDPSTLDPDASMRGAGIDSLALVEYLFAVEDRFGISMPDESDRIDTLRQLAALVDRLRSAQTA